LREDAEDLGAATLVEIGLLEDGQDMETLNLVEGMRAAGVVGPAPAC